jgi:hypothetical protein
VRELAGQHAPAINDEVVLKERIAGDADELVATDVCQALHAGVRLRQRRRRVQHSGSGEALKHVERHRVDEAIVGIIRQCLRKRIVSVLSISALFDHKLYTLNAILLAIVVASPVATAMRTRAVPVEPNRCVTTSDGDSARLPEAPSAVPSCVLLPSVVSIMFNWPDPSSSQNN